MGILEVLFVVFLVLKLVGVIAWSWFWVCFPMILEIALVIIVVIVMLLLEKYS